MIRVDWISSQQQVDEPEIQSSSSSSYSPPIHRPPIESECFLYSLSLLVFESLDDVEYICLQSMIQKFSP